MVKKVKDLSTEQVAALTTGELDALTTADVAALSTVDIASLGTDQVPAFVSAEKIAALKYLLLKNHSLNTHGRNCEFYEAGTEFDIVKDAALLGRLAQSDAQMEMK